MESEILRHASGFPVRRFDSGELLIRPMQPINHLYVLKSGSVEVLRGDVPLGRISTPGALFGEVSAIIDTDPIATVRALSETECYEIEDVNAFVAAEGVALEMVRDMARRLKIAGERIQPYS